MSLKGLARFEEHFLFSNRLFQFLIRIRPDQNPNEQFVLLCAVLIFVLPIILYQVKVSVLYIYAIVIFIIIVNIYIIIFLLQNLYNKKKIIRMYESPIK